MAFTAKILSWRFRLLKRRPTKGGSRAPQDPPPQLRPWGHVKMVLEADDMIISSGGEGGGRNGQIRH